MQERPNHGRWRPVVRPGLIPTGVASEVPDEAKSKCGEPSDTGGSSDGPRIAAPGQVPRTPGPQEGCTGGTPSPDLERGPRRQPRGATARADGWSSRPHRTSTTKGKGKAAHCGSAAQGSSPEAGSLGSVYDVPGELALVAEVREILQRGPKEISYLASRFASVFNTKVRGHASTPLRSGGRNDGSFKRWLLKCGFELGPPFGTPVKNRNLVYLPTQPWQRQLPQPRSASFRAEPASEAPEATADAPPEAPEPEDLPGFVNMIMRSAAAEGEERQPAEVAAVQEVQGKLDGPREPVQGGLEEAPLVRLGVCHLEGAYAKAPGRTETLKEEKAVEREEPVGPPCSVEAPQPPESGLSMSLPGGPSAPLPQRVNFVHFEASSSSAESKGEISESDSEASSTSSWSLREAGGGNSEEEHVEEEEVEEPEAEANAGPVEPAFDGPAAGRALLSMLQEAPRGAPSAPEPQPLSRDEYQLWAMEAREDAELGADTRNAETFGEDSCRGGWSFEENLAANAQLLGRRLAPSAKAQPSAPSAVGSQGRACAGPAEDLVTWHMEVRRLNVAMRGMARFVHLQPGCLEETVRQVICRGWEHITWKRKYTGLHLVAELGRDDLIPLLLLLKADINALDSKLRTPLDIARTKQRWNCMWVLTQFGAKAGVEAVAGGQCSEVKRRDSDCAPLAELLPTPAFLGGRASASARAQVVRLTLEAQRHLGILRDLSKLLSLEAPILRAIQLLVAEGSAGRSVTAEIPPLHLAAAFGRDDVMPLLAALGADPDGVDYRTGLTAVDFAKAHRLPACVRMLERLQSASLSEVEVLATPPQQPPNRTERPAR